MCIRDRIGSVTAMNLIVTRLSGRHIGRAVGCELAFRPMRRPYLRPMRPSTLALYAGVVVRNAVRSFWAEPRVPHPPARVWRDWMLVAALVPVAVLEVIFREDLPWRPVAFVLGVAPVFTLLWRRTPPLVVVAVAFGAKAMAAV